ncbi:Retrovirus-related Pol polyprotein from transposon TNT 1-94 [Senna tora]|uniref:Retrovirus-related Pol polyprotein from transposon TNT 1-94 n=1 Tax=Senna tora TaxID=362788 RepID=A0A834W8J9_9FABA|nr:Retrovirus-related Pol polyprotein from transposon TNT 1-94 [Senna tora]
MTDVREKFAEQSRSYSRDARKKNPEPSPLPVIPDSEKELKVYSRRKKDSQARGDEDKEEVDETRDEIKDLYIAKMLPWIKGNTAPNLAIFDECSSDALSPPIAKRNGVRTCTLNLISLFVSYDKLSPRFQAFISNLDKEVLPNSIYEALQHPKLKEAVNEKIKAL